MSPSAASNESERLAAVRRYSALDISDDPVFTGITRLAADFLQTPIAAVSLVDSDQIRFATKHGTDVDTVERSNGLCDSAIRQSCVYHVRDASLVADVQTHPLVSAEDGFRFYAAAPLRTHDEHNIGTLCTIDREPRDLTSSESELLANLATIVMNQLDLKLTAEKVAKLEREERRLAEQLAAANEALSASEERFRDLFDEAPIAYVHEDVDSRFIRANRTAMRTLGLSPDNVVGTMGISLVPDKPDAQRRVKDALDAIGHGTDTKGVVLELQRADNGKPVWIQWWSRPSPDGTYTRTMFLDITDRVQMERENKKLEEQNSYLQEEIRQVQFDQMIGETDTMKQVFADIEQVAPTPATVLILGETGTGKELVARAVHKHSDRAARPLIKVNCSALPGSLIESELFGHEKGAFTGATARREGRFSLADGACIFLDEIGDLPIELQSKLLRVLQEGEFEPLGSSETRHVDVRVIAATNRDLFEATQSGEFREDLYFRLAVFPITLPPLKDRLEDLPALADLFVTRFAERLGIKPPALRGADVERLATYRWPGNVRELRNVVERALITSVNGALNLDRALPESTRGHRADERAAWSDRIRTVEEVQRFERDNLRRALEATNWQISGKGGAAELLGMNPTTLSSRLKSLGLRRGA